MSSLSPAATGSKRSGFMTSGWEPGSVSASLTRLFEISHCDRPSYMRTGSVSSGKFNNRRSFQAKLCNVPLIAMMKPDPTSADRSEARHGEQLTASRDRSVLRTLKSLLCRGGEEKRFGQRTLRRNNEFRNTCYRPNRLNLLSSTVGPAPRSNFLREIRIRTNFTVHESAGFWARSPAHRRRFLCAANGRHRL
jgi:hypothetical protein